jgi:hypothetical protein
MKCLAEIEVPGTGVSLPDLKDMGISEDEVFGMTLLVLVPLLAGVIILISSSILRYRRNHRGRILKTVFRWFQK